MILTDQVAAARGGALPEPVTIAAQLTTEDVRRAYYEQLGPGQDWYWIREMQLDPLALIVDDDEGGLWMVPVTVTGEAVSFGQPEAVRVEYVPSAAVAASSAGSENRRAIVYADRTESRGGLTVPDLNALRERLGLAADVPDDEVVTAALAEMGTPSGTPDSTGAGGDAGTAGAAATPAPATPVTPATPQPVAAAQAPPGFTLIADAVLSDLSARADQGVQANTLLAAQAEDAYIGRHRNRIGASTNPHAQLAEAELRRRWAANPTEAETFAASLPVVVHSSAPGHAAPGDEGLDAEWEAAEAAWFPEVGQVRASRRATGGK